MGKCTTILQVLTAWCVTIYACCHHKLCASLQLCVSGERTLPSYHQETSWSIARWSIVFPGGTMAVDQLPTRQEREATHPGKDCAPRQRGSFRHHLRCHADLRCELCSQGEWKWKHFWSARGMWHSWVPGGCDISSTRGMSFSDHKTMTLVIGSSQVWLALLFTIVTTTAPTPDQSWGTSRFLFLNG